MFPLLEVIPCGGKPSVQGQLGTAWTRRTGDEPATAVEGARLAGKRSRDRQKRTPPARSLQRSKTSSLVEGVLDAEARTEHRQCQRGKREASGTVTAVEGGICDCEAPNASQSSQCR